MKERWANGQLVTLRIALACVTAGLGWAPVASQQDCCYAPLNLGFSTEVLRGTPPFEGVAGAGPLCAAADGFIDYDPASGPQMVYVNIVSRLRPESVGAQGGQPAPCAFPRVRAGRDGRRSRLPGRIAAVLTPCARNRTVPKAAR